jgi:uncharacterized membrane protein YqjE
MSPRIAAVVAMIIAITRLIAYAINDDKRWWRFLFLVFLLLAVAAGWWLLTDGGVQAVLHDSTRYSDPSAHHRC